MLAARTQAAAAARPGLEANEDMVKTLAEENELLKIQVNEQDDRYGQQACV
jgi:hypothetical protein